jgi:hypothetical protein
MAQQKIIGHLHGDAVGADDAVVLRPATFRMVGALLALAVATAHVVDQGGLTAFTFPDWLGWAYRLIEVGGVLVAASLVWPRFARLGWFAAVLLGVGPFVGYIASRTVGVPGDPADVGNWGGLGRHAGADRRGRTGHRQRRDAVGAVASPGTGRSVGHRHS